MSIVRSSAGVPKTYRGWLWSKILDAMVGAAAADGDLLVRSGGVWTRKAIGTSGHFLKVVSGAPDWAAQGAGGGGGDFYTSAYQANDQYVDNTTTGTTFVDSECLVTLADAGTYRFLFLLFTDVNSTPDYKARLHFTGTASSIKSQRIGIIQNDTRYFNGVEDAFDLVGTQTTTALHQGIIRGTIVVTGAGDLSMQFAQNAASATPVGHLAGGACLVWKY